MNKLILKLSGEAIGDKNKLFNFDYLDCLVKNIKILIKKNHKIIIIIGGGNIMRGKDINSHIKSDSADYIGMQATNINAYMLNCYFSENGLKSELFSRLPVLNIISPIENSKIVSDSSKVIIIGGGTGKPGITTDSGAVEAALEFGCDEIWFGKNNIDGIYSDNPSKNSNATKIPNITYSEYILRNLKVIDLEAIKKIKNTSIISYVFNINNPDNISNFKNNKKYSKITR